MTIPGLCRQTIVEVKRRELTWQNTRRTEKMAHIRMGPKVSQMPKTRCDQEGRRLEELVMLVNGHI